MTRHAQPDLGPCGVGLCTADAVAFLVHTLGRSARLTIITGPRATELAACPATADTTMTVCHEHAAQALDELLGEVTQK
jgi:hypothetical protein